MAEHIVRFAFDKDDNAVSITTNGGPVALLQLLDEFDKPKGLPLHEMFKCLILKSLEEEMEAQIG